MSRRERRRYRKADRHHCVGCRGRKALFRYRGEVRADRDHTLCFECFRCEVNRARARRIPVVQRCDASDLGLIQESVSRS
jgi:hypothetical protein